MSDKPDIIGHNVSGTESMRHCKKCGEVRPMSQKSCPCSDIIGIVKELQTSIHDGKGNWYFTENDRKEVARHFPAIAQALLIAYEAIEQYEKGSINDLLVASREALSRIRSLPST